MVERAKVYPLRRKSPAAPPHQPSLPQRPGLQPPRPAEPLWREVLGQRIHALRVRREETLAETAGRAGLSPQYLSEIERGRKEPSSEMIAALAGALGTTLTGLTEQVAGDLRRQLGMNVTDKSGPVMLAFAA
ncbi:MAG: helix-turn-helix transcriptional regulator [Streptosporangiaceae bacterium]